RESRNKLDLVARTLARVSEKRQAEFEQKYRAEKMRFEQELASAGKKNPFLSNLLGVQTADADALRQLLEPQTALIDYYLVADQLSIWVVSRRSIVGVGVEIEEKRLAQSIDDFRSLMQNFSTTTYLGSELADLLLKPITPMIAS